MFAQALATFADKLKGQVPARPDHAGDPDIAEIVVLAAALPCMTMAAGRCCGDR
jgi:hypothetical protein